MIDVVTVFDTRGPTAALNAAVARMPQTTTVAMGKIGEEIVLPAAKARAAPYVGPFTADLIVKARANRAILTTKSLKAGRIVGMHEFGGTVRTTIKPKKKQAVKTPWGPRAEITTPRVYKGHRFLLATVVETYPRYERSLVAEMLKTFQGLETSQ